MTTMWSDDDVEFNMHDVGRLGDVEIRYYWCHPKYTWQYIDSEVQGIALTGFYCGFLAQIYIIYRLGALALFGSIYPTVLV